MPAFFLTFLAVAVAVTAGREALRVARLREALGGMARLSVAIVVAALAGAALAAWIATAVAAQLGPDDRLWFVAIALGIAAAEVLFYRRPASPREPTRSIGPGAGPGTAPGTAPEAER
jgi:hypothetical protein